jgi:hypothetical protein
MVGAPRFELGTPYSQSSFRPCYHQELLEWSHLLVANTCPPMPPYDHGLLQWLLHVEGLASYLAGTGQVPEGCGWFSQSA